MPLVTGSGTSQCGPATAASHTATVTQSQCQWAVWHCGSGPLRVTGSGRRRRGASRPPPRRRGTLTDIRLAVRHTGTHSVRQAAITVQLAATGSVTGTASSAVEWMSNDTHHHDATGTALTASYTARVTVPVVAAPVASGTGGSGRQWQCPWQCPCHCHWQCQCLPPWRGTASGTAISAR